MTVLRPDPGHAPRLHDAARIRANLLSLLVVVVVVLVSLVLVLVLV